MGFTVSGLDGIKARIDAHVAIVKVEVQDAIEWAVANTYDDSQKDCPYDQKKPAGEPHLRDSAKKKVGKLEGWVSYGNDEVDWEKFVELGTSKMRPQPYLFPAFIRNGKKFREQCKRIAGG